MKNVFFLVTFVPLGKKRHQTLEKLGYLCINSSRRKRFFTTKKLSCACERFRPSNGNLGQGAFFDRDKNFVFAV